MPNDTAGLAVTAERAQLAAALATITRITPRSNIIPILSNVLLRADGDGLALTGTDLNRQATVRIAADVRTPGATTVSAQLLADLVKHLPADAVVSLDTTGDRLTVRAGRSRLALATLDPSDFPDLSAQDFTHSFQIEGRTFARLIKAAAFCASTDQARPYLEGIYLHTVEVECVPKLRAVATDGHRLARADMPAPDGSAGMPGIIIGSATAAELLRMAEGAGGDPVTLDISGGRIRAAAGGTVLVSKLIDGTFPDYQRVIPTGNDKRLRVEPDRLAAAAARAALVAGGRDRAVRIDLDEGRLTISTESPEGDASEEMEADYDAAPLSIGISTRYLADVLAQFDADTILVKLADPGSPILFQADDGADALYVVMPMRV